MKSLTACTARRRMMPSGWCSVTSSLGIVEEAPQGSGFTVGDPIVGIVRRPDPLPCASCAAGEWDMCRNGGFTERGIKERHGFGSERFRIEPAFAVAVDRDLGLAGVLMEPASIVAKAWDHVERVGRRSQAWSAGTLLVTGAGPIGQLAALMGRQRNLDVHVLDRNTEGPKPGLIRDLGATHHAGPQSLRDLTFDIVMECTAAPALVVEFDRPLRAFGDRVPARRIVGRPENRIRHRRLQSQARTRQ